jgi:hypothetical protein
MSRKMGRGARDSAQVEFHFLINSVFASNVFNILFNASAMSTYSTRWAAEADLWAHFRVKALKFRLHPMGPSVTNNQAIGFVGGVQDTLPGTVPLVMELLPSTFLSTESTVPTEWVVVPKQQLAGPLPWYKAINGAADATEESPGAVVISGVTSDGFIAEFRTLIEFKTAVAAANTPLIDQARLIARAEKVRLLREREAARVNALLVTQLTLVPSPLSTSGQKK